MLDHEEQPTGIAIIGLAGRFPGATTIQTFWQNLCAGIESITFFDEPAQRTLGYDSAIVDAPNYIKAEPLLADIDLFDAAFFGFTPREAEVFDPQQRLFLEAAWEALEVAGYDPEAYTGAIGVFGGMFMSTYLLNNLIFNRPLLASVGELALRHGNDKDYLATRVSYKLNLKGPSMTVQTSCSTSLVATHLACQSLLNGECDLALAGGVSISVPQQTGYLYQEGSILSPDGHCRAFDEAAQGTIFGSGVGVVTLKRVADALEDGDHIYAVIKGSAINNDGSGKVGYTAPSVNGQRAVIAEALAVAEVEPETVSYVEAHGTGTPLGDPIEIAALTQAFRASTDQQGFCAIGAVKTNIGHLGAAAGIAGLIKTALALKHKQIPPSLHFNTPNPQIDFATSPFYVNTTLADWSAGSTPRRAGVSSFGMGGTNAHMILEEAPVSIALPSTRPSHLLVLSAKTGPALEAMARNLAAYLRAEPDVELADVAATLQRCRRDFDQRLALVCQDTADAINALESLDPRRVFSGSPEPTKPPVVFMFPGQGAQYSNMAHQLYQIEPSFHQQIDRCARLLEPQLGLDLRHLLFNDSQQAAAELQQTRFAQVALFVIEYALAQLWLEWGVQPRSMIGHSIGEYVAACLAGVFSLEDALRLVVARGRLMQATPAGAMLSVPLSEQALRPLLSPTLSLAAINGPALCVVSGPLSDIAQFEQQLDVQGVAYRRLHTSHAFHSLLMEPILESFTALVRQIQLSPPQIPYISNVSGTWITAAEATDPAYWARHLRQPVRFADGITQLLHEARPLLLEVGPGRTLSALARQLLPPSTDGATLSSLRHPHDNQPDLAFLLATLGKLWLAGAPIHWARLYEGERRVHLPLPTYPFQRKRYWVDPPEHSQLADLTLDKLTKRADLADWFYISTWKRSPLVSSFKPEQAAAWLVFVNDDHLSVELVAHLTAADQRVVVVLPGAAFARLGLERYTIRPDTRDDYAALLADLGAADRTPARLLHLWGITPDAPSALDPAAFASYQERGVTSLLLLGETLESQFPDTPLQILVVTNQTQQVISDELICPTKATTLAVCATIPRRYQQLACRCVDVLLPAPGSQAEQQLVAQLLAEQTAASADSVIAIRKNVRWVQTFEQLPLSQPAMTPIRAGGVYLLSDGLSARGLAFAAYLARSAQVTLLLMTDQSFPGRETWTDQLGAAGRSALGQQIRALVELEALGARVEVLRVDLTQPDLIEAALGQIGQQFGACHGLIHFASVGATNAWSEQLQPVAERLLRLDQALNSLELDFRLAVVDGAGLWGQPDRSLRAAASLLVATIAQHSSTSSLRPWRCLVWDDDSATADPASADLAPTPDQALLALTRVLALDRSVAVAEIIVSTADLPARIAHARPPAVEPAPTSSQAGLYLRPSLPTAYVAPSTPLQETLIGIWQSAFGIDQIGIYDNFFDLGGHSLLAMQLVARLRAVLEIELPIRLLFEAPTIAELTRHIEATRAPADAQPPIMPIARTGPLSLSFAQQRLWFLDQLEGGSAIYNMPTVVRLSGRLDVSALEQSFNALLQRHEVLRTTFAVVGEQPVQIIAPSMRLDLPLLDLQPLPAQEREREAQRLINAQIQQPSDLTEGPLLRAMLLRLHAQGARAEHILVLVVHHIVADGWSMQVVVRELGLLYETISQGRPLDSAPLPPLPVQYADFAHWQREWLQGAALDQQLRYWRQQLSPQPPVLDLATDQPRPPLQTFRGARQTIQLSESLTEALKALSQRESTTFFMTLLAAFQVLLHRYTDEEQIIVGSPVANRGHSELQSLIGLFANTLVLNTNMSGRPSFRELLQRVREVALGAYAHQDLPFEQLVDDLKIERDLRRNPIFQVLFSMQQAAPQELATSDLTFTPVEVASQTARFDLTLSLIENPQGLLGTLEYNTDLFYDTTARQMLEQLQVLLQAIVADPDQRISGLPLLSAAEQQRILSVWNQTRRPYPRQQCVQQLIERQVEGAPGRVAAVYGTQQLTYAELNQRANQLAHYLRQLGVGQQSRVAIFVDRSLEMLVALLGVLKSGAAYIPLDPIYPPDRLAYMLTDAAVPVVVTQQALVASLPPQPGQIVRLDADWPTIARSRSDNPEVALSGDHLAYLIYTSGSTGQPKGVQIPHRAVVNFLTTMAEQPGLTSDDVLLAVTTLSFDIAGLELLLPLIVGARVVIASRAMTVDGAQLARHMAEVGATMLQATPATWRLLVDLDWRDQGRVTALCGGEAVPRELADELLDRGVRSFWNMYGPTETTIWSSVYQVTPDGDGSLPIGRPIANTTLYVLDRHMQPVPIGVPGELYIGGDGLAHGYLKRAALTAEKFVPNPFGNPEGSQLGARLYRTGDLVRYRADGNIDFLRRIDHQVKLRGFRIELHEIEAVLRQHPAVQNAAVLLREDRPGDPQLVAYVVAHESARPDRAELRGFLKQTLPEYMLPGVFVSLDALPLTPNGKLNRRALPAPDPRAANAQGDRTFVTARTLVEQQLVRIWSDILQMEQISIHDNFFELGGHSLLVTRLMFRVRAAFQIDLPLRTLFDASTVAELARAIERAISGSSPAETGGATLNDLRAEVALDPAISAAGVVTPPARTATHILLTGATGFLGAFLLRELLLHTSATITCLVRAGSPQEALDRLRRNLAAYGIWQAQFDGRIVPLVGDLAQPLLGLSADEFHALAARTDAIYHNGALVNFIYPYASLKAANVLGTQETLRLASQVKLKPVYFVSTHSTQPFAAQAQAVAQQPTLGQQPLHYTGYIQSKWVAEQLVLLARERGLPVTILRPGRISGASDTGACQTNDFLWRMIKACVQVEMAPDLDLLLDMTPVEHVARSIVQLQLAPDSLGQEFNLVNPEPVHLRRLVEWMRVLGYPIKLESYDRWRDALVAAAQESTDNAAYELLPVLTSETVSEDQLKHQVTDLEQARAELPAHVCPWPQIDDRLLATYFGYFIQNGYLPLPPLPHADVHDEDEQIVFDI